MATGLSEHAVTVLLIDDQPLIGQAVKRMLAEEPDVTFHYCKEPDRALETAIAVRPTIILQDLVLPDIDGLDLVKLYRESEATRDVPVIVLSTREEPKTKADAFALGANDYIVKLPDKLELIARIRHHSKGYINQLQRDEAYRALVASQEALAHDVAEAAHYVQSLLPATMETGSVRADWRFIPSAALGGDTFGYHQVDDDHLAFYLIDVVGHGVGAALLSVSVLNAIRSQSLPQADFKEPGQVITALNDRFEMSRQGDKYFTAWYGVYSPSNRVIRYSGGGHPPALLIPDGGGEMIMLEATGPMVGAFDGLDFETREQRVEGPGLVYLYSDGVFEIEQVDGERWPFQEFLSYITGLARSGSSMDMLIEHIRTLSGKAGFDDDFSIVQLHLDPG
ncbi:fused response regulator/phosphatase [Tautonia plasticadhaerens]|uniref:Phosphoserine phosphatase RsbP n=1 Tax=Tautonia plasticadhaerens TaxID=2527974 RepID=A0A518H7N5_9BACT|nr:fused response regulator/phosphatase [Tautonia plasticadhaerens]QDV36853.1 Phosphoserine phosphatase RsbP [Tautonia plasticadhaerens]